MGNTVLVVGGGGREHALAWTLTQSPQVDEVLLAPGNAGTAVESGCRNLNVSATDNEGVVIAAKEQKVRLVVVGPEDPLVDGLVDACEAAGVVRSSVASAASASTTLASWPSFGGASSATPLTQAAMSSS